MNNTTIPRRATRRSEPDIPPGFDPKTCPIIARHFYGVDLRNVRAVFWNFAHRGVEVPTKKGMIVVEGGRP